MADLNTDVRYIRGIGEQRAKALGKLQIATLRDLISYFPRSYEDRSARKDIRDLADGETVCVEAMVAAPPTLSRVRKGLELVKLRVVDATGTLDITFFNQAYQRDNLRAGNRYTYRWEGRGEKPPQTDGQPPCGAGGRPHPHRPHRPHLSPHRRHHPVLLVKSIQQGLEACRDLLADPLPDGVRRDHNLCHIHYAYDHVHFSREPGNPRHRPAAPGV